MNASQKGLGLSSACVGLLLCACSAGQLQPLVPASSILPPQGATGDSFVLFSDAQQFPIVNAFARGGPRERRLVRERIHALAPSLVLYGGDAVGYGTYGPFWQEFSHDYQGMTLFPVLGNHDLMGPDQVALHNYFALFPHLRHRRWYELRFGPVLFLLLDSNRGNLGAGEWTDQLKWIDKQLAEADQDTNTKLVVLLSHHPPLSTSTGGGDRTVREDFYERAVAHSKFKLYMSGHHHSYQHIVDQSRHVLVAGGGGGPLYYHQGPALPEGARLATVRYAHHVVRGVLTASHLRVEMHELGKEGGWGVSEVIAIPYEATSDRRASALSTATAQPTPSSQ